MISWQLRATLEVQQQCHVIPKNDGRIPLWFCNLFFVLWCLCWNFNGDQSSQCLPNNNVLLSQDEAQKPSPPSIMDPYPRRIE